MSHGVGFFESGCRENLHRLLMHFWTSAYKGFGKVTKWRALIGVKFFCILFYAQFNHIFAVGDDFGLDPETFRQHKLQWQNVFEAHKFGEENLILETNTVTRDIHQRNDEVFQSFVALVEDELSRQLDVTEQQDDDVL